LASFRLCKKISPTNAEYMLDKSGYTYWMTESDRKCVQ
jgi:hypothetical protein